MNLTQWIANSRKAIIQVCTLIVTLGTAVATYSNLSDKYAGIITAVVGLAGTVIHYATPNADAPGTTPATEYLDPDDTDEEDDSDNPEYQPAELVTADQVSSSVPPGPSDSTTPTTTPETTV